jgi:AcrR family transcriptional regulator
MAAAERREQILDAAIAVFARSGYRTATTTHVAEAAGISQASIFKYFKTRDELFLAVIDRIMERTQALFEEAIRAGGDPLRILQATAVAWRSHAVTGTKGPQRDVLLNVLYQAAAESTNTLVAERLHAGYLTTVQMIARLLERARASGQVRGDLDVEAAAWQLIGQGLLFGLLRLIGQEADEPTWRREQQRLFFRSLGVTEDRIDDYLNIDTAR